MQYSIMASSFSKAFSFSERAKKSITFFLGAFFFITTTRLIVVGPVNEETEMGKGSRLNHNLKIRSYFNANYINRTSKSCKNFVIFDADNYSGSLSFLNEQLPEWCAIVVNLKHFSQLSSCLNCTVLKDEWVYSNVVKYVDMDSRNDSLLTTSHVSKMAAYLYALRQGADWIYTSDRPLPIPYPLLSKVAEKKIKTGPVYQGPEKLFEPCSHFVDHLSWRGRESGHTQGRYNIKMVSSHSIYQIVDSCYRLDMDADAKKKSFDHEAPAQYVLPGTYAVLDFQNVLVPRTHSWILVASLLSISERKKPVNSTGSAQGAQFNMMVQRMSWDTDTAIGFIPGRALQPTCQSCDLYSQFQNTSEIYKEALSRWRCDSFQDIPSCLLLMTGHSDIIAGGLLKLLVRTWMSLLRRHAISFVQRIPYSEDKLLQKNVGIPLYYSPSNLLRSGVSNDTLSANPFQKLCQNHNNPYHSFIPASHPISNILLIIVFNFPFLVSHIPLLEYMYGRHFKHVLYCGESITEFEQRYQKLHPDRPVSFIEIKHYMGYWAYNCMSAAIKMGYDVTGYLQISDDVIINIWNFDKLPYRQPWFQSNMRVAHIDREIVPDVWINRYWWPWSQFSGKKSAMAAFNHLESMVSDPDDGDRISAFMENLYNITNCNRCFLYEASDIFYLPQELGSNFTFFSDIFSYNRVFLEITIPTVLSGITSDKEVYRLRGNYLWFYDRNRYPYVYTEFDHFYHAWKFSQFGDKQQVRFLCRHVLSRIDNDLRMKDKR